MVTDLSGIRFKQFTGLFVVRFRQVALYNIFSKLHAAADVRIHFLSYNRNFSANFGTVDSVHNREWPRMYRLPLLVTAAEWPFEILGCY